MTKENELNSLAEQYAYYSLGSSPCEDCDDKCYLNDYDNKCKEAQEYHNKYINLVKEYKNLLKNKII